MTTVTVKPEEFGDVLIKALKKYGEEVYDITETAAKMEARGSRSDLKASAPEGGKYARGWSVSKKEEGAWGITYAVHNRQEWQIIHLLEYAHPTGGGGRYPKNVDYTGTLARIEEEHVNKFMEGVMAKL